MVSHRRSKPEIQFNTPLNETQTPTINTSLMTNIAYKAKNSSLKNAFVHIHSHIFVIGSFQASRLFTSYFYDNGALTTPNNLK
ncbi:hypothetical protein Sbal195_4387 [Shewanella baltica OS195]|uniref:Uncharacterized protein n=1 Tax=Shewanella baltica (strain OS195) TaxID=399599 RepID=A9KVX1_SHEB9|nr:hypothetical protein Sbal195_4387 [Shewanella baltica OS195]